MQVGLSHLTLVEPVLLLSSFLEYRPLSFTLNKSLHFAVALLFCLFVSFLIMVMIDYADPCAMGPLNCSVGCRPDSDVESCSIFSGYSRRSFASVDTPHGNAKSLIDALKHRVTEFQSKGWLSQQEHRKYMTLLMTAPTRKESISDVHDHVLTELEKELNMLEEKMNGGTMLSKQTRMSIPTPENLSTPTAERSQFFGCARPFSSVTNKTNNEQPKPSIVDPKELSNDLSDDQISELFVETCFFARLGFVQPPCCLQCTYRESMKEAVSNANCGRWVIWRRDANHILHPHELCSNAIAVRCHTARKLLAGKSVENHKWDKNNKVLIQPRNVSTFQPGKCI
jgi:hypothetical protein